MVKKILSQLSIAAACLLLILILKNANDGTLPDFCYQLVDFKGGDKIGHIGVLGAITFFITLPVHILFNERDQHVPVFVSSLVILILTATFDEIHQARVPGRTFDLLDLFCSYFGIFLGALVGYLINIRLPQIIKKYV